MNTVPVGKDVLDAVVAELKQSPFFHDLSADELSQIAGRAKMVHYQARETIMRQGDKSDSFAVVASGEVIIKARHETRDEFIEIARVKPYDTVGELGMLLNEPRSASVVAGQDVLLLVFDGDSVADMFRRLPSFGLVACRVLAKRLKSAARSMPIARDAVSLKPNAAVQNLLPLDFVQRHRVLPLEASGNVLTVGFVDDPTPSLVALLREQLPGMDLRPVAIDLATYNTALRSLAGAVRPSPPAPGPAGVTATSPANRATPAPTAAVPQAPAVEPRDTGILNRLLRRMVAERASDLHLSAHHRPRWRIDGEIAEMADAPLMGTEDVLALMEPILPERNRIQFQRDNDTDFAHAVAGVSRFRVNLFRDNRGVGAVFRQIPDTILTIDQLGLPPIIRQLCDHPKGLVLVTGPTGSGKSTTLAAMIDHLNKTRRSHIVTLEDPIEFVHPSQKCLVNQREVGPHTTSFARALRAVLREDPDIVLVGEMRDLETVSLALETANTGHLVFGTLHTNTAIGTVARIIDMFPADQQNQVRAVLADTLKGVIAQTLCRKVGGGRVAALEILIPDSGIATLIRDGKTHQVFSAMQTGKARGSRMLNDELVRLVKENTVAADEALHKAIDKPDLAAKLGLPLDA